MCSVALTQQTRSTAAGPCESTGGAGPTLFALVFPDGRRDEQRTETPGNCISETVLNTQTFSEFESTALAQGFDQVVERRWPPLTVLDTHVHPFSLQARVVSGEMWLSVGDITRHLCAGDTFELARDVPHAERYGPEGATYWVARRNSAGDPAAPVGTPPAA